MNLGWKPAATIRGNAPVNLRDRLTYVASDATERPGLNAVLVRPDGFVAWASETHDDGQEAAQAGSRWFGEPGPVRDG